MQLIGIVLVAVGFFFRWNTLLVVTLGMFATGLVSGMSMVDIITMFGQLFVDNRYMPLAIILTLPVIGLLERYGMKQQAEALIMRAKNASTSKILTIYLLFREGLAALGLNVGGHAQMVRPLIVPMAEGAAISRYGTLSPQMRDRIRATAAATDNTGWFFGEDILISTGALLLMKGFFDANGIDVEIWDMALWGIPTAVAAFLVCVVLFRRLERALASGKSEG
ncbi:MAG: DUF969 domain-containing protein [Bacilli bacterium]